MVHHVYCTRSCTSVEEEKNDWPYQPLMSSGNVILRTQATILQDGEIMVGGTLTAEIPTFSDDWLSG